jgi:hypothetical protein
VPFLLLGQGDQIGRFFAYCAVLYFGLPFEKYKVAQTIATLLFYGTGYVKNFDKRCVGYILGDPFTNSSGHPVLGPPFFIILFVSTTLLTGMTGISLPLQWPQASINVGCWRRVIFRLCRLEVSAMPSPS